MHRCCPFVRLLPKSIYTSSSAVAKRPREASCLSVVSFVASIVQYLERIFTGRPARSAAMPVLFLLTGPKMGFSPRRGDTLPRESWHGGGPLPRANFHVYRGKNMGIQPPKLSKFRILAINLPLRAHSFAQFFTKFSDFVRISRWI